MTYRGLLIIYWNERTNERLNETISNMSNVENKNETTIASMEPLDTGHVEGTSKSKKSKRVSNRGVTKRGFIGDESHPKESTDNETTLYETNP